MSGRVVRMWVLAIAMAVAGCTSGAAPGPPSPDARPAILAFDPPDLTPQPRAVDGLRQLASVEGTRFSVHTAGGDLTFLPGVNLGATVPGHAPGELRISREDVRRWLPMMRDAGFRVVRVYTILPPHFYEELRSFNLAEPENPLYLAHGIWIPEEQLNDAGDLLAPEVVEAFDGEIDDAVAAVAGDTEIEPRPGHAGGTYTADVTDWLVSWIVGVELDPWLVVGTDEGSPGRRHEGDRFSSRPGATPTEAFLARAMDRVAIRSAERGLLVPTAFVNWPTTDPLDHPTEPLPSEDLVGVDANAVVAEPGHLGGTFASYHAYPYYPDFQRDEPGIADARRDGAPDPYAGYLRALQQHHEQMPVMITEFGVPSGLGSAHAGPLGRDQGGHDEQSKLRIDADLLALIADEGLAGGYVFAWIDEWFKFTWNTIDLEIPGDRRPLWFNPFTNESQFGVIAAEPGEAPAVLVDGSAEDWGPGSSQVIAESRSGVSVVRARHDEAWLYLLLEVADPTLGTSRHIDLVFDVTPGGAGTLPDGRTDEGADVVLRLGPDDAGQFRVAGHADHLRRIYGSALGFLSTTPSELEDGAGSWTDLRLITNRPQTHPLTGEVRDAELWNVGRARRGTTDPADPEFDSLAIWQAGDGLIEVRVPYAAIGFADPSSRSGLVVDLDGRVSTTPVDRVGVRVVGDELDLTTDGYSWDPWNRVTWHERPKVGLEVLTGTARAVLIDGLRP